MHRWSPDEILLSDQDGNSDAVSNSWCENPDFVEDRPADRAGAFMKRLEQEEREALYAMVREEVSEEIRQELHGNIGSEMELIRGMLIPLKDQINKAIDDDLHSMALGAVELAVAIGERLARSAIAVDDTYLVRCLEDLIDRKQIGAELTVIAHPSEVAKLEQYADQLRDLNVVAMTPELALPPGGCIVKSGGQEWDLTFRGQSEALATIARDAMIYGKDAVRSPRNQELDIVEPCEVGT